MENITTPAVMVDSPVKFTGDEAKELAEIRVGFEKATITFGKFYLQRRDLEKAEAQLNAEMALLEKQEKAFLDRIVAKYGEGSYDPQTDVFTPKKKN
jgi:hypothetical protein